MRTTSFCEATCAALFCCGLGKVNAEAVRDLGTTEVTAAATFGEDEFLSYAEITPEAWEGKALSAADFLAELTGVEAYRQGGLGSFQTVSIRGIAARNIVVCMDGVPMNDASGGAVDLGGIDLNQIEKIEVYKDRVPAKFGANGLGGAINFVTKKLGQNGGKVVASVGSHGLWEASAQVRAAVHDSAQFSATLSARHSDNDYEFESENGTAYNTEDDYTDTRENADYTDYHANLQYRLLHASGAFSTLSVSASYADGGNPGRGDYQTKTARFGSEAATVRYLFEAPELTHGLWLFAGISGGYVKTLSSSYYPLDHIGYYSTERLEYGAAEYKVRPEVYAEFSAGKFEGMVRLEGGFTQVGARGDSKDWELERFDGSLGGELTFRPLAWLALGAEGSALLKRDEISEGTFVLPTGTLAMEAGDEVSLSYSARAFARAGSADLPFGAEASVGRFSRQPQLMELYGTFPGGISNPDLEEETALKVEAGAFMRSPSKRSVFRATYFEAHTDNGIFWLVSGSFTKPVNIGEARIRGVELELESRPASFAAFTLRATFQDPKDVSSNRTYHNKQLPGEPTRAYLARATCFLPLGFEASWTSEYRSRIFTDRAERTSEPGVANYSASLGWNYKQTKVIFALSNITDEAYRNVYTPFPVPGREFKLTLVQSF